MAEGVADRIMVIVSRHIQSISDITDRVFPEIKRKITTRL